MSAGGSVECRRREQDASVCDKKIAERADNQSWPVNGWESMLDALLLTGQQPNTDCVYVNNSLARE